MYEKTIVPQTCNSISIRNSTYFTSPEYPSLINGSKEVETNHNHYEHQDVNDDLTTINEQSKNDRCSLTIHRMPGIHPICQIRLVSNLSIIWILMTQFNR